MGAIKLPKSRSGGNPIAAGYTDFMRAIVLLALTGLSGYCQSNPDLQSYLRDNIKLSQDQIAAIRAGQPVARALPPRTPAEVFLFGAVYINAAPETYLQLARDVERLRNLPDYLALGVLDEPPQLSDWNGFSLDSNDIQALKNCRPGDCQIQMPASTIEELHRSINWSAADAGQQLNQFLRRTALQELLAYQREGNEALGVYNDKHDPTEVSRQFAWLLSYDKALPGQLADFYHYLLAYPHARPANVDDTFYWSRVKFGLKPTLRVVQMVTMHGEAASGIACAVAEKQLYASHYFETALDLSYCVRGDSGLKDPGFYLIMIMGSEQAGLTGVKGSVVRKAAVGRSVSSLQVALTNVKNKLEAR
jgi:hypothetical protein